MPIELTCTKCDKRLRVRDEAAGKRIKCPKCQEILRVPKPAASDQTWQMQTPDGETYGPISKSELDAWAAEGRVTADCQLLREGADSWQWAADIYPQLAETETDTEIETASTETAATETAEPESKNPFDFAAADISPTARLTGRTRKKKARSTPAASRPTSAEADPGTSSPRDQLAAALLGIFAGAWGVHSFYLGKTTKGIIQIVVTGCTCGVGGLWGIIEGFMLLGSKTARDAKGRPLHRERF